jgi:hypothetical protein
MVTEKPIPIPTPMEWKPNITFCNGFWSIKKNFKSRPYLGEKLILIVKRIFK